MTRTRMDALVSLPRRRQDGGNGPRPASVSQAIFYEATTMGKTGEDSRPAGRDVQPGTGEKGKSWQSHKPDPDDPDDQLEKALEDSFRASAPPQPAQPGVTGWDADEETAKKAGGKR